MRRAAGILVAVFICAVTLSVDRAEAECALGEKKVDASFSRLLDQSAPGQRQDPTALGFLLYRQTRFLGESESRRAMFDCVFERLERWVAFNEMADSLTEGEGRVDTAIEEFRSAALGLLSDEELRFAGINPDREIASMFPDFAEQWIGRWELVTTTPTVVNADGSLREVRQEFEVARELDGSVVVRFGPTSVTAEFTETAMRLRMIGAAGKPIELALELTGAGCSGAMLSVAPSGKTVHWTASCSPL